MPRIRTLKPEFWADEKMSLLDPLTRLVFLGLVSLADDAGRLVDNVKQLDGMLFPNTDDSCHDSLETLARTRRIIRYRSASGQPLIQIAGWDRHQKVDHPNKHVLPAPSADDLARPAPCERPSKDAVAAQRLVDDTRDTRAILARPSRDPRATTMDHGPTTMDPCATPNVARRSEPEPTPPDQATTAAPPARVRRARDSTRGSPVATPRADTWLSPYLDAWRGAFDADLPAGPAAAALRPLEKRHGAPEVLRRWGVYVRAPTTRAQYASAAQFARSWGQWVADSPARPDEVDLSFTADGTLTAYGERLLRGLAS